MHGLYVLFDTDDPTFIGFSTINVSPPRCPDVEDEIMDSEPPAVSEMDLEKPQKEPSPPSPLPPQFQFDFRMPLYEPLPAKRGYKTQCFIKGTSYF